MEPTSLLFCALSGLIMSLAARTTNKTSLNTGETWIKNYKLVQVIPWFEGQLPVNFQSKILMFLYNCLTLFAWGFSEQNERL